MHAACRLRVQNFSMLPRASAASSGHACRIRSSVQSCRCLHAPVHSPSLCATVGFNGSCRCGEALKHTLFRVVCLEVRTRVTSQTHAADANAGCCDHSARARGGRGGKGGASCTGKHNSGERATTEGFASAASPESNCSVARNRRGGSADRRVRGAMKAGWTEIGVAAAMSRRCVSCTSPENGRRLSRVVSDHLRLLGRAGSRGSGLVLHGTVAVVSSLLSADTDDDVDESSVVQHLLEGATARLLLLILLLCLRGLASGRREATATAQGGG